MNAVLREKHVSLSAKYKYTSCYFNESLFFLASFVVDLQEIQG